MKMISIIAATVLLAGSATSSFAQGSYFMGHTPSISGDATYAPMTTGRSVSATPGGLDSCQRGEPTISPNGIASLDELGACHSDMSISR